MKPATVLPSDVTSPEALAGPGRGAGALAARIAGAMAAAAAAASPWRDLATRLFLAQGFVVAGAMRLMHPAPALADLPGSVLADLAASQFGAAFQLLAPILLGLGLFSRAASLALLIQLALLPGAAPDAARFWAVLLLWLLARGPGPLSLDALLAPAMRASAIPGTKRLGRAFAWAARHLAPPLLSGIRLWIAALTAGPALAGLGIAGGAMGPSPGGMLPPPPGIAPGFGALALLPLAALLALGLGTRPVALALLCFVPWAGPMAAVQRLFWLLLLALPLVEGPGPLALDPWLGRQLRRLSPRIRDLAPEALARLPHVVVVGGGFAGIAAAQALAGAPCRITLIDRRNFTLFQPLLYQVATAALSPADIATPIRALFRGQANVRVLLGEVTGIEPQAGEVRMGDSRVPYDWLILATGSRHAYFGRDEWAPLAPGLKQIEDATTIRRRLLSAFEAAERSENPAERAAWQTFVVVGGGPTGVELAGAIAELAQQSLSDEFREADPRQARVLLVQSEDRVLPVFPPKLSAAAAAALRGLGVELRTGQRVTGIDETGVTVGAERIPARTVLWAAGVMASPAGAWLGAETDRAGRVRVEPDLAVPGHPSVFAIGDTALSDGWNGKPVPGLAPAAKQQGHYVARVIRARLAGRRPPPPFRYRHQGSLATIGRESAVADLGWVWLRGALAWWFWGAVHLLFLIGGRNRATVLVEWLWAYLTGRSGSRLITGEPASPG